MQFNGKELASILKMGLAMANADGVVKKEEEAVLAMEIVRFGVPKDQLAPLFAAAQSIDAADALGCIRAMSNEQKKYVAAYLGTIMACDGDIDDAELKLWKMTCTLCDCPSMNIKEAVEYMANL